MRKDISISRQCVAAPRDKVTLLKRELDVCGEIGVGGKNVTRHKNVGVSCSQSGM